MRHMATDAGQHVLGTMVAGSSGHRRTQTEERRPAPIWDLLYRIRRASGFYSLVGGRGCAPPASRRAVLSAGESGGGAWSSTGRGAGPRMRSRRVQPSPRGGAPQGCPLLRAAAGVGRRSWRRSPAIRQRTQFSRKKKKNRRPLVKQETHSAMPGRICVRVVDRGGTPGVDHSSSLSLFGPNDPSTGCKPDSTAPMVILITSTYCVLTQMVLGQPSKPFVIITSFYR